LTWVFRDNFLLDHHRPKACSPGVLQLK